MASAVLNATAGKVVGDVVDKLGPADPFYEYHEVNGKQKRSKVCRYLPAPAAAWSLAQRSEDPYQGEEARASPGPRVQTLRYPVWLDILPGSDSVPW